jgi:hypothetical protein
MPNGHILWKANAKTGDGEGYVFDPVNPRFVPGKLVMKSREICSFIWSNKAEV